MTSYYFFKKKNSKRQTFRRARGRDKKEREGYP
jgi:hypothetical protein